MKIGLIDVDGHNFPNLPLMKISAWHKDRGDTVDWYSSLLFRNCDKVYMSKVFTNSLDYKYPVIANEVVKGGTGYNYPKGGEVLTDEIEHIYPDYSLYPQYTKDTAYGFLTRGCPRNCDFCIVSKKEGRKSVKVANLEEFWKGQKTIKLLDPNILAYKNYAELFEQLIDSSAWIDFTQGLDIRLTTDETVKLIKRVKTKNIHFAWDNPKEDLTEKFRWFKKVSGINYRKLGVYVLTNFSSTHEEDLWRIYTLRDIGYNPYVMIYNKENASKKTRSLQRWVNNRIIFQTVRRFEDYNDKIG